MVKHSEDRSFPTQEVDEGLDGIEFTIRESKIVLELLRDLLVLPLEVVDRFRGTMFGDSAMIASFVIVVLWSLSLVSGVTQGFFRVQLSLGPAGIPYWHWNIRRHGFALHELSAYWIMAVVAFLIACLAVLLTCYFKGRELAEKGRFCSGKTFHLLFISTAVMAAAMSAEFSHSWFLYGPGLIAVHTFKLVGADSAVEILLLHNIARDVVIAELVLFLALAVAKLRAPMSYSRDYCVRTLRMQVSRLDIILVGGAILTSIGIIEVNILYAIGELVMGSGLASGAANAAVRGTGLLASLLIGPAFVCGTFMLFSQSK